jgi:hypothetical protein
VAVATLLMCVTARTQINHRRELVPRLPARKHAIPAHFRRDRQTLRPYVEPCAGGPAESR